MPSEFSAVDRRSWQLFLPEKSSRSSPDAACDIDDAVDGGLTFNFLEALPVNPADTDTTTTQSDGLDMEILEESEEQLIRETDEAFKAVGNALADAQAVTHGSHCDPISIKRSGPVSRSSRREMRPIAQPIIPSVAAPSQLMELASRDITCTKSQAKGKRKALHRKKNLMSRVQNTHSPLPRNNARWTLTHVTANVVDIFCGKIFKIEADETLTPDRLRLLKREEKIETDGRISVGSTCSVETDGSTTEPFHLESLSSRLAAMALKGKSSSPFPCPVLPPLAIPQGRRNPVRKGVRAAKAKVKISNPRTDFEGYKFPSTPRLSDRSVASGTLPLPTISEIPSVSSLPMQLCCVNSSKSYFSFGCMQPSSDCILLPSTSFTLTNPSFRQGPIRLERKEKEVLPDDEALDWTAFQMAISGTMDEIGVDERDEIEWAADEAEVDEILDWWKGYNFPGYGRMIGRGTSGKPKQTKKHRGIPKSDSDTDKIVVDGPIQRGTLERAKKDYNPVLGTVTKSLNKEEEDFPMGFNLGHDLGDFLDWEANYLRNCYAEDCMYRAAGVG
jgi:hypothetical protein